MAKAKLTATAAKWVQTKNPMEKAQTNELKKRLTLYVSEKASKLLWHSRAETGTSLSRTVEGLVLKHLSA